MHRKFVIIVSVILAATMLSLYGCEKEKVVESTEYIHDIEYVELPADTVYQIDTIFNADTVAGDTITDTLIQTDSIYDTTVVSDTVIQTEYVYDTVVTVEQYYDTVVVTDTVVEYQFDPESATALNALHFHCDPLVIEFIYQEFGINDGWIFYLSNYQVGLSKQSSDIYDIHGYIDYWTPDWSGFYPLEFYWRMTYNGGDPSNPSNWDISMPPDGGSTYPAGVRLAPDGAASRSLR